jgi:TatA/E family protein of Tat protein translocase
MLHSLFLIGNFGTTEILLIVFVIVLLFGAKRIPELFRGMGQGVREFKDASKENEPQYRDQSTPPAAQPPYQQPAPPYQQPVQPYQQPTNPADSQAPRV